MSARPLALSLVLVVTAARADDDAGPAFPDAPAVTPCLDAAPGDMACIPGGPFLRGVDKGHRPARPQATVWVQTFYMDKNEVTSAAFRACVKDKKCPDEGPNYRDFSAPRQPINGVSWYGAKAFCEAHGKRLPTEAEWEKAARGTDGRRFPWGNQPATCKRAVIKDKRGRSCGIDQKSKRHAKVGRPNFVGSKPPNPYGLYDMAGNSWEWVADWYTKDYGRCGAACRGVNPKGPCDGEAPCEGFDHKVVRGGSWYWPAKYATTFRRRAHTPSNRPIFHHFGFRCAADVDAARALGSADAAP